ncbi:Mu transposase C-terminal domain-containing protein [Streptacidiphilus sp. N1-3]|uniref:Mu transposase C-terminal domain-containing protein n=1 Tax=Streptacidiphilus alkalitolerans TaxID=3342712 RepID=A0ABV6WZ90_9ACTN
MTLRRAIRRDLSPGERAGLAAGERAARRHDVFLARPRGWRNQVWETDHVQAPVRVDVQGQPDRPWITWFVDCATSAITGAVVTAGYPSRESVLAALRSAVLRTDPYGPLGGLPEKVRMDRGRDFLSRAVQDAFVVLKVEVEDLPAYTPHLKGTVEGLNRSVERMFLAALPGYVHQPRPGKRPGAPKDEVLLSFQEFTDRFLAWVLWWNTEHRPTALRGLTPLQAWEQDPTPLREVPPGDLWTFTLEDAGTRKLTTRGVRFKSRDYVAAWMTGNAGITVRVRYMPHHDHEVEVFDPVTGRHLGAAHLADQATADQVKAVRRARQARTRRLAKDLKDSQEQERYAASAQPEAPRLLGVLTTAQAERELARSDLTDLAALALPGLIPHAAPPTSWSTPPDLLPPGVAPLPTVAVPTAPLDAVGPDEPPAARVPAVDCGPTVVEPTRRTP